MFERLLPGSSPKKDVEWGEKRQIGDGISTLAKHLAGSSLQLEGLAVM
jgi:hypothetical protein